MDAKKRPTVAFTYSGNCPAGSTIGAARNIGFAILSWAEQATLGETPTLPDWFDEKELRMSNPDEPKDEPKKAPAKKAKRKTWGDD